MARRAMRQDDNHGAVVTALRAAGAVVHTISQGGGLPDLLCGYESPSGRKYTLLLEIKDGEKVPSARKLTTLEEKFFETWIGGPLFIVNSPEEAVAVLHELV